MYKIAILLGILCVATACSSQDRSKSSNTREQVPEPIPAGAPMRPAEEHGYIDAVDPNAYPPTYGQGAWEQ